MMEYKITRMGEQVGVAKAEKEGLYYRFICRCKLPGNEIHTIYLHAGSGCRKLGICVPRDGDFWLQTKVPAKHIGDGPFRFEAQIREEENCGFYPVLPEKPFVLMDRLADAKCAVVGGSLGLIIKD